MKRRNFIQSFGAAAIATAGMSLPAFSQSIKRRPPPLRIAVFFDSTFPVNDEIPIARRELEKALEKFDVHFLNSSELKAQLGVSKFDLFINPYGSKFPKGAWQSILKYLRGGGNFVNLGGVPFAIPVDTTGNGPRPEIPQVEFHKQLGITQSFRVKTTESLSYHPSIIEGMDRELKAQEVYEFYVRFTNSKDFPDEDGSSGPREAVLRSLVIMKSDAGKSIAAPVLEIDRLQGEYAGGRWVLANFRGAISTKGIRSIVERACEGASELIVRPSFACYRKGEIPSIEIQFRRPKGNVEQLLSGSCRLEIFDEQNKRIETLFVPLHGNITIASGSRAMSSSVAAHLRPGLYRIEAALNIRSRINEQHITIHYTTGFWIYDEQLLAGGRPFTLDRNYFLRDGNTYPVTGTTYMGSDVHRKFLLEPNPFVWNQDFHEMKSAGVNMVRTGIWTGWKKYMSDAGVPNETALRATDAFFLTARKFDIPIIFTLFAFLPETWGGKNPYLDPRSVNAQQAFVRMFSQRYGMMNDVMWDVINEPSFCSPSQLWSCRPNYDIYEREAWKSWLREKYVASSDDEWLARLQEMYRASGDEAFALPSLDEFSDVNVFNSQQPVKVIDYRLFAQEMFIRWVKKISDAVRSNGNAHQVLTVGQDEGGTYERPGPQFFHESVDFTSIHNWWFNDDLVWDNVMTKSPGKPNLVEETGIMFYEKMNGSPWRSEEETRNLLERKLALSIGAGGAGFIEWVWNTNPYMASDNEAAIGLTRADGTEKPEREVFERFAKFFSSNSRCMQGKKDPDVVMVIPHSQMFSVRNFATDATRRCVRVMQLQLGISLQAISEYRLASMPPSPALIMLPSPTTLNEPAWQRVLSSVEKGSTLLVTGAIDYDDHWMPVERMEKLGVDAKMKPIAQEEFMIIDGTNHHLSYRGEKIQRIEKAVVRDRQIPSVHIIRHGNGKILWSPLPVEISDDVKPTIALYNYALKEAALSSSVSFDQKESGVFLLSAVYDEAVLSILVSEGDEETLCTLTHHESQRIIKVNVPAQRTAIMFLRRKDGEIISKMD